MLGDTGEDLGYGWRLCLSHHEATYTGVIHTLDMMNKNDEDDLTLVS